MKQKIYPAIGYWGELTQEERERIKKIKEELRKKYNLPYTSYVSGRAREAVEVEIGEGIPIQEPIVVHIPLEPLDIEDFTVVYLDVPRKDSGCRVVLAPTEKVRQLVAERKEIIYQIIIHRLKGELDLKKMWEREYSPKTPGNIPWSYKNYRILLSALDRMSRREMRNFYPSDIYVARGILKMFKRYLRVYRRIADFVAHAASAGWLDLEWNAENSIIEGENLFFYNGNLAHPEKNPVDVPIIPINL